MYERSYLTILLVIGVLVRWIALFLPMRYDESFTFLFFISQPLNYSLTHYPLPNNHLLYTLFAHILYLFFPFSQIALRFPAFLAGVMLIPVNYIFVRRLYNKEIAFLSSGLIAVSSVLIEYSANARGYTLYVLFSLLILYYLARVIFNNNIKNWSLFIIFSVCGFYTIPIMLYPLVMAFFWFLLTLYSENKIRYSYLVPLFISLFLVGILTFLLYSPVIANSGLGALANNKYVKAQSLREVVRNLGPFFFELYQQWSRGVPLVIGIFFSVVLALSLWFDTSFRKKHFCLIFSSLLGVFSVLLLTRHIPFTRCLLFLLPIFFSIVSAALYWLYKTAQKIFKLNLSPAFFYLFSLFLTAALYINILAQNTIVNSEETGQCRSASEIVSLFKKILKPNDAVVSFIPCDSIMAYYFYIYGLSPGYLLKDYQKAQRIFIVLRNNQEFPILLKNYGMTYLLNKVKLRFYFRDAKIYVYNR